MTEEEKIEAAIGAVWEAAPTTIEWEVNGPNGPTMMSMQWRNGGYTITVNNATGAVKDARENA